MTTKHLDVVVGHIRRLTTELEANKLLDHELLKRVAQERNEAAFQTLVARYGPMVLGVCRRVLSQAEDVEDAFQATFLVLARKAASIGRRGSLRNWLYGVAYRTAARAKVDAAKRRAREAHAPARAPTDPMAEITLRELLAVLDAELSQLPAQYQGPLLLCYLEGKTRDEAAAELGWSLATLGRRLERGRELLRNRLARKGLTLPVALVPVILQGGATPAVPISLSAPTIKAAMQIAVGTAAAALVSAQVAALSEGVIRTMLTTKFKQALLVFLTIGLLGAGVGMVVQAQSARSAEGPTKGESAQALEKSRALAGYLAASPQEAGPKDPEKSAAAKERLILKGHSVMVWAAAFSPDGKTLASAAGLYNKPGELILWDAATGRLQAKADEPKGIRALAFSPDGKTLASADYYSNKVTLRDPATLKAVQTLQTPFANNAVAFSPDGKRIAAAILNPEIQAVLWDDSGKELRRLSGHTDWSSCAAFSLDGKLLATGSRDKTVKLWDVATGQMIATLAGHDHLIEFLAFSPDGHTLASASWDKTARLWEVPLGKERAVLKGHKQPVLSVNFSPDGRTLATTGGEVTESPVDVNLKPGEVKLWDVSTLESFATLATSQDGRVWMSCFSPDGRTLATVAEDKTIKLWDLTPRPAAALRDATDKELADWWNDLAGDDAAKAYRAVWALAQARPAASFLEKRVHPSALPPAEALKRIDKLIAELNDDNFAVRQRASLELEKLGAEAEPAMRKALDTTDSAEVQKRINAVLKTVRGPVNRPETLQALRAVEALELAGTDAARHLLEALAKGAEHDRQTQAAKAVLDRLARRKAR